MKYTTNKLLILPLLGFLAAGCSTSSNLQTSEIDDVYFSSKDQVTYVEPALEETEEAYASEEVEADDASKDITERVSDPASYAQRRNSNNTPYQYSYYDAPFGNPYYAYASPFYSPSRFYSRAAMMNPWMDPWYDPFYGPSMASMAFYDPFWPQPGLSIGIGLGFGRFYNPWGAGYGFGYNPYRYGYGGLYNGGYYDNFYGGGRVIANRVAYGRRDDRSTNSGHNPNISRETRGGSTSASSRSSNAVVQDGTRTRSSRAVDSQAGINDGTTQRRRRQTVMPAGAEGQTQSIGVPSQERRVRTSTAGTGTEGAQPVRRQRTQYTPMPSTTETRTRSSYEPTRSYEPSRSSSSSYEPTRSSSSSSGSSSGGSSSGGGSRRGRN